MGNRRFTVLQDFSQQATRITKTEVTLSVELKI